MGQRQVFKIIPLKYFICILFTGMDDPLVDDEGFPRSDIDVYQVRHARHNIRCKVKITTKSYLVLESMMTLQTNDLSKLMKQIEMGLQNLHSQARETAMETGNDISRGTSEDPVRSPFARVMVVVSGSPADTAGIKQGDLVTKFGTITKVQLTNMANILFTDFDLV